MGLDEKYIHDYKDMKAIISRCSVCRLGMAHHEVPYIVPLCFGFDGDAIYFHTGLSGRSIIYLKANPNVCCEFDNIIKAITNTNQLTWDMSYAIVIANGYACELTEKSLKLYGIKQIIDNYSNNILDVFAKYIKTVRVWKVNITSMSGKYSG